MMMKKGTKRSITFFLLVAVKRADAGVEQPSRGATACQATSGLACLAEALRRRKRQIDGMVYALYPPTLNDKLRRAGGLTAEEIKIVKDSSAK